MKKKVGAILLCGLMAGLAGCGGKTEAVDTGRKTTAQAEETEETNAEENKESVATDALGGVYPDADELTSIPMGTCIDGEQVNLVNVEMPLNYIFGALYIDSNGEKKSFENASGGNTLLVALESKFQDEPYAMEDVNMSLTTDTIEYRIVTGQTFDELKESVQNDETYSSYTEKTIMGKKSSIIKMISSRFHRI